MTEPELSAGASTDDTRACDPFEFSDEHKDILRRLASSLIFAGISTFLFGGIGALIVAGAEAYSGATWISVGAVVAAIASGALSWWMLSSGRALSAIVSTRGLGVEHLIAAAVSLRLFFWVVGAIVVAAALCATAAIAIADLRP
jgi:hypothetical protein